MTTNNRPRYYTSRHPHIERAARRHQLLLNVFGLMVIALIVFVTMSAALLGGQL